MPTQTDLEGYTYAHATYHAEGVAEDTFQAVRQAARTDAQDAGRTYLLGESQSEFWTQTVVDAGMELPKDFQFNRLTRLWTPLGAPYFIRSHRDHPDLQGAIALIELEGEAGAVIEGLGKISLAPRDLIGLSGWPVGHAYPAGRVYQNSFGTDDPRTSHSVRCEAGPREVAVVSYDYYPDSPKHKYTGTP